jgi:hypothetical protein
MIMSFDLNRNLNPNLINEEEEVWITIKIRKHTL